MGAGMNRDVQTEETVKRLVAFFAPERVYLFGSTARGEDRPDSDLDFLIVLPDDAPHEKLFCRGLYRTLYGLDVSVDVVPVRRRWFEQRRNWLMSLSAIAIREGRLVYDAQSVPV
jgi:predicted nucleotidyltransferase